MCNWKKAVTVLAVLGLALSITCVGYAGHRKHKEKKNKQTTCTYGKEETVKALPEIIQLLRERGYAFGVVTPMTPQAW